MTMPARVAAPMVAVAMLGAAALLMAAAAPTAVHAQTPVALERRATFHEPFGFLQAVREMPDGRVVVADPLGGILAAIDLETGAMVAMGREGGGPGEWRQPDAVFPLPGDSTLVVDLGNTRLSLFGPAGEFVRSYPMVQAPADGAAPRRGGGGDDRARGARAAMGMMAQIIQPRATDRAGRIYFQARGGMGAGGTPDSLEVRRWDRDDAPAVTVARLRPPAVTASTSAGRGQGQARIAPRPLAPGDDWAVAPDGRVALVRAEPYRVEWLDPDGRLVRGPIVDYQAVAVGTPEKQRWLDALGSSAITMAMTMEGGAANVQVGRGRAGGRGGPAAAFAQEIDDYEWPADLPPFRSGGARVDPNGRVWVEGFNAVGTPVVYDVFDRRGFRIARVALPDGHRVIGFGRSAVYAVRVDELGLHWLEVFAPPR